MRALVSRRQVVACSGAVLVAHVGFAHEAGVLGVLRIPVVWLATVVSVVGWIVLVGEALWHGGFHFFAFTLGVAGAVVAVEGR